MVDEWILRGTMTSWMVVANYDIRVQLLPRRPGTPVNGRNGVMVGGVSTVTVDGVLSIVIGDDILGIVKSDDRNALREVGKG